MSRPNKNDAISNLVSGVAWSMNGEEISHWDINNVGIAQPTDEAINTELTRLQTEYDAKDYARKRKAEYPDIYDYMDGIVKSDQAQIDKYIADCQAVKDKYSKGE
tara:strand:- start:87 stop:401 length:315 start_codon:yes stop_codon:yes gene_type:complete